MKVLFFSLVICLSPCRASAEPSTVLQWRAQAEAALAQGHSHLAIWAYDHASALDPSNREDLQASARLLALNGYPRLARHHWQALLNLDPSNAEASQQLKALRLSSAVPDAITPSAAPIEAGQGLWIDGDIRASVKTLNDFNLRAPLRQRIRQTYVNSGQLILAPEESRWALDLRPVQMAADTQAGDTRAQLWIQVDARGAHNLRPEDCDRLGTELAALLKGDKRVSGILLEPRPASPALYPLYNALRLKTGLPLTVAVGSAQPQDFHYADVLMLRAWPRAETVDAYKLRIGDEVAGFLKAAEQSNGKAMVALAGNLQGPGKTAPYLEAGQQALSASMAKAPTSYVGYALHGLLPQADGTQSDLEPEVWQLLMLPVAAAQ